MREGKVAVDDVKKGEKDERVYAIGVGGRALQLSGRGRCRNACVWLVSERVEEDPLNGVYQDAGSAFPSR